MKFIVVHIAPGTNAFVELAVIFEAFLILLACLALAQLVRRYYMATRFLERMDARFQEHLKLPIITKHWLQVSSVAMYQKARPKFWQLVFSTKPLQDVYWFSQEEYTALFTIPFTHEELKSAQSQNTQA